LPGAILASGLVDIRGLKPTPRYGGSLKSNVSDYLKFMEVVYIDATMKCVADVSDLRDLETLRSRVKSEGMSFLTITLPQFARDFERSIAIGYVDSTFFRSFRKNGSIPAFLQGMTSQVFDRDTGRMYDNVNPQIGGPSSDISTVVESVRQLCLTFKKVELECSPARVASAIEGFIAIEQSFDTFSVQEEERSKFLDVSSLLWNPMVIDFSTTDCIPSHGPGQTADRITGNRKYVWQRWHDRLEPYFPLIDNGYPLGTPIDAEELKKVTIVPEYEEQPTRVVTVPKTLKSPRVIAIEPCCMQYVQHGIQEYLYDTIESYWLTAGHINFRDQSVNQSLAMTSSKTGRLATIDLSDASDRVPRDLALEMFRVNPDLFGAIEACRSTRSQLPDGRIIEPLRKFASMGSALCFPVEAMYFYTLCVMALLDHKGLPYNPRNIFNVTRDLYVYGDDIIVPTDAATTVLDYLQRYNCKVNTNKTFVSGSFRESCGVDAFKGYEVTPTYVNKPIPKNRQQASELISWVATANLFYLRGYWRTASFMFERIERILGPLPFVSETSEALGRISYLGCRYSTSERNVRWNSKLQRIEINAWIPSPVFRTDRLDGYGALTKCFLGLIGIRTNRNPISQERSKLERSALHGAVSLKRRWVPAL